MENKKFKIALVHDFLVQSGGAEKVLFELCQMYPEAPIYTLLYDKEKMDTMFAEREIRTSYLQKLPKFLRRNYRWLMPFFPVVPETFDFRDFDLVISSTGAWSKGIVTKLNTLHVSYVHSPMRFVWDYNDRYLKEIGKKKMSFFIRILFNHIRTWDFLAAQRPEFLIANSLYTQKRIEKYYRRNSVVIYPPVGSNFESTDYSSISNFESNLNEKKSKIKTLEIQSKFKIQNSKFFLVVSRLSAYKRVDVAVEAFNKLGLPLVVIGEGEQKKHLRKIAKENVKILGWQSEQVVEKYFQNARAFVFPTEDDFGIAPVEAMSFGLPVIAYRKGGVLETVEEGVCGEFFDAQTPEVLADGVRRFMKNEEKYDREVIKKTAQQFSKERFRREIREYMDKISNSEFKIGN